jgi:hypothetical protein
MANNVVPQFDAACVFFPYFLGVAGSGISNRNHLIQYEKARLLQEKTQLMLRIMEISKALEHLDAFEKSRVLDVTAKDDDVTFIGDISTPNDDDDVPDLLCGGCGLTLCRCKSDLKIVEQEKEIPTCFDLESSIDDDIPDLECCVCYLTLHNCRCKLCANCQQFTEDCLCSDS